MRAYGAHLGALRLAAVGRSATAGTGYGPAGMGGRAAVGSGLVPRSVAV
jgi:hypothetical protein